MKRENKKAQTVEKLLAQHTAGPWKARGPVVSCSKGVVVVVEVASYPDETQEEHEAVLADARLIAAAPDLLAVCEALVEMADVKVTSARAHEIANIARDALSKARGA